MARDPRRDLATAELQLDKLNGKLDKLNAGVAETEQAIADKEAEIAKLAEAAEAAA